MIIEKVVFQIQLKCANCGLIWYMNFGAGSCIHESRCEVMVSKRSQVDQRIKCPNCEISLVEVMSRHPID